MGHSEHKRAARPGDLTEFLAEMRHLELLRTQGVLTRQEYSRARRQSFLAWLLAHNPELLTGRGRRKNCSPA
ncbi:MAG: hypothetical protein JO250_13410 [Armatimonadetes bacterium]|nr:hypothetical protein [Armatimonadota bacterium]